MNIFDVAAPDIDFGSSADNPTLFISISIGVIIAITIFIIIRLINKNKNSKN